MRERTIWIAAGLLGLVVAIALALLTSHVSQPPVGVPGEPVSAGRQLAPPRAATATRPARARPATTPPATRTTTTTTTDDDEGDEDGSGRGRGRGRGRGGDD